MKILAQIDNYKIVFASEINFRCPVYGRYCLVKEVPFLWFWKTEEFVEGHISLEELKKIMKEYTS